MIVDFWPRYNLWLEDMRRSRKTDGGSGPRGSEGPAVWPNNGMTSGRRETEEFGMTKA